MGHWNCEMNMSGDQTLQGHAVTVRSEAFHRQDRDDVDAALNRDHTNAINMRLELRGLVKARAIIR